MFLENAGCIASNIPYYRQFYVPTIPAFPAIVPVFAISVDPERCLGGNNGISSPI